MDALIDITILDAKKAQANGRLFEAQSLYKKVLESSPNHPEANHLLGDLLLSKGETTEAARFLVTSISVAPTSHKFWLSYIEYLRGEEKFFAWKIAAQQAKRSCLEHKEIDLLDSASKAFGKAKKSSRKALKLSEKRKRNASRRQHKESRSEANAPPDNLTTAFIAFQQAGEFTQAEELARYLIRRFPNDLFGWKALGVVLQQSGRLVESLPVVLYAADLSTADFEARYNLGVTLQNLSFLIEAEEAYQSALSLQPNRAEAHNNLGVTQLDQRKFAEAERSLRRAVALQPMFPQAFNNLGNALTQLGSLDEAIASYRHAILLNPDYAEAHTNLGNCLRDMGDVAAAEASYTQALELAPELPALHSNLLMLLGSLKFSGNRYLAHAKKFADLSAKKAATKFSHKQPETTSDQLRIGFVSGDFRSHPVGYFLEGLLGELQGSSLVTFGYPTYEAPSDEISKKILRSFDYWHPITNLDDEKAATQIYQDKLDILIDLSGHTNKNRLPIFAWQPAPIQATWLGYFASSGLPEMDFIIGDSIVTPPEEEPHFIERVWRLPETYLCFTPPSFKIEVGNLPAHANKFITFGCFNKLSRMSDEVIAVRAEILRRTPNSKLFLKDRQLANKQRRQHIASRFATHGICTDRLILEGSDKREQYLRCYNRVDIGLSPFPYGGGTTIAESLWMSTPVLVRKGDYFLSHIGHSFMNAVGLPDWVAADNEEFIDKAVQFSEDITLLAGLNRNLREQALMSPLFDVKNFARDFERALWEMVECRASKT